MGFVGLTEVLTPAVANHYAVGHFNYNGLLWGEAFLEAANEERSPIIIATSDRIIEDLGGFQTIKTTIDQLMIRLDIDVPVVLHLDHGRSIDSCFQAIDAGYSSVMYDGSHDPIEENIANTKRVVDYAHKHGCSVEAEVGTVGGNEDGVVGGILYASLEECVRLVQETNVDALAAALGSVHGRYAGVPKLGFAEMEAIQKATNVPLVLHGASGIPKDQIQRAIELGHAKINVNTEFNIAWINGIRETFEREPLLYEPKLVQAQSKEMIKKIAKEKIREFGSNQTVR